MPAERYRAVKKRQPEAADGEGNQSYCRKAADLKAKRTCVFKRHL